MVRGMAIFVGTLSIRPTLLIIRHIVLPAMIDGVSLCTAIDLAAPVDIYQPTPRSRGQIPRLHRLQPEQFPHSLPTPTGTRRISTEIYWLAKKAGRPGAVEGEGEVVVGFR